MTRCYDEYMINMETRQRELVAKWGFMVYPGDNNHLSVSRNGIVKTVYVEESTEFVFKLLKTKIKAIGGASGIFNQLDNWLYEDFCNSFAWKVLRHCFYDCKEAERGKENE